jgi:CheY-like chemotaxis protein
MSAEPSADILMAMALRCLIVDDNPGFLAAASELLEREGIREVGVASSSSDALEQAAQLQPDLTLVDIDLGAESGFDLVRLLAQDSGGRPSSMILISTYAERDFAELIEESPATGFMPKADLSAKAIHAILGDEPEAGSDQDPRGRPGTR